MPFLPRAARRDLRINPTLAWIQPPCQPGPDSRISNWRGAVSGCGNNRGRHLTAWADREMQAERFRTYSKMKGLMALATGLSMIFQIWRTCGRRACDLPALPTRDLVGDEVALHGRTGRQVGRGAHLLTGPACLKKPSSTAAIATKYEAETRLDRGPIFETCDNHANHGMRRVSFGLYACRPNDISPLCNVRVRLKMDSRSRWG